MALTLSRTDSGVMGDLGYWMGTATFDAEYAAGGESFTAANAGLDAFVHVAITPDQLAATTAVVASFDDSANKIQLFENNASGGTLDQKGQDDVSNLVVYIWALGKLRNK